MEDSSEASTLSRSYIDVLLKSLDKSLEDEGGGEAQEEDAVPDSTTSHTPPAPTLRCGDDVLVPNKDGKYYLGSIIELSTSGPYDADSRCLIKFGDGTRSWAATSDVKLLSAPPLDDGRIMCVVCKRREGEGGAVIACDMCGRGYHGKCHTPTVDTWIHGASWNCKVCVDQRYKTAAKENRAQKRLHGDTRRGQFSPFTQQPCDTASTTSSTASEQGKDDSHCYCGEKSDWLAQMLMCCRCSRWFHQRCVSSLQYPLYAGDKLYIFSCATCNGGSEYLRRLELRWLDLAHLALYNLTAYSSRNYFDLDAVIMPYIMDNWHALQLPEKMWCTSASERREKILTALTGSRSRFKSGREMKKRATIWGLRVRRPPPHPLHLNALAQAKESEALTDDVVHRLAPRLRFLPRTRCATPPPPPTPARDSTKPTISNNGTSSYTNHYQNMIVPVDGHWLNLMMGKRFHQSLQYDTENDSPCSSPSPTEFMNNILPRHRTRDLLHMNDVNSYSPYSFDDDEQSPPARPLRLYKYDYLNGGFVKKSVPFARDDKSEEHKKKSKHRRNGELDNGKRLLRRRDDSPVRNFAAFSRDQERSPSADPEIILKGDCSTSSFDSAKPVHPSKSSSPSPPSEPSGDSVQEPPPSHSSTTSESDDIKAALSGYANAHTSKIAAMNLEISKMSTMSLIEHSKIQSLQCREVSRGVSHERESSGDENLGRVMALDAIIPPLKDFQGKNNPFLMNSRRAQLNKLAGKGAQHARLSLPATQPVRPLKRQLSEKDLIIGPNGEVKRRKFRRSRKSGQLNQSCPLPGAAEEGSKASQTYSRQSDEALKKDFHGRRLRQRQERNYLEHGRRPAPVVSSTPAVESLHLSPHKNQPPERLSDLKSSVRDYFGALTRMRAGDSFTVLARRTTRVGDTQYLIEWASHHVS